MNLTIANLSKEIKWPYVTIDNKARETLGNGSDLCHTHSESEASYSW